MGQSGTREIGHAKTSILPRFEPYVALTWTETRGVVILKTDMDMVRDARKLFRH